MPPAQLWESTEVGVRGDPFAVVLDGERRVIRVGNEIAGRLHLPAEPIEDLEVTRAGLQPNDVTMT